jgi:acetyltransferase-like isoleucine patch superfamily enzyme
MSYFSEKELALLGFKHLGKNVKISTRASIYNFDRIEIGDFSRIDDFCLLSGKISIGKYVHIAPFCNLAGGEKGIFLEDFVGIAYGAQIFTQTDDYSGLSMTSPLIPEKFKRITRKAIYIDTHSIIGTNSIIMPGAHLHPGTSVGLLSVVYGKTREWSVYSGNPAVRINERSRMILDLTARFLMEEGSIILEKKI